MKRLILLLVMLLASPLAVAGKDCGYIGSWLGYDANGELYWTSQIAGMNSSRGTIMLEVPGFDMSLGGMFDVDNYTTTIKGAWVRTGGHTYSTNGYAIATNADGDAVLVLQLACDVSLADDCDVLEVQKCTMSLFEPNPESDPIPIWDRDPDFPPVEFPPHNGYRIKVDQD